VTAVQLKVFTFLYRRGEHARSWMWMQHGSRLSQAYRSAKKEAEMLTRSTRWAKNIPESKWNEEA